MAGKLTDRKGKAKDGKEKPEATENFTLPTSLTCSEVEFPVLVKRRMTAKWTDILADSQRTFHEIEEYEEMKRDAVPKSPFINTECDYIKNEIFVILIPALEETLNKAKLWQALNKQKCFFNGIDHMAQDFPRDISAFIDARTVKENIVRKPAHWCYNQLVLQSVRTNFSPYRPRPYYPKSWLWPEEYAATLIQKTVRQYFVQREEEVQEMRDFWKKVDMERHLPDMEINPFLAKKFASEPKFHKK